MQQCLLLHGPSMQLLRLFGYTASESVVWTLSGRYSGKCQQLSVHNVFCCTLKFAYVCACESTHLRAHFTHSPTHPRTHPSTAGDHSRWQGRMAAASLPRKACGSARNLPFLRSGQWRDQQRVLAYCACHRGSVLGAVLLCWGSICGWTGLQR